jgi:sugar lactone lactonase YvrE
MGTLSNALRIGSLALLAAAPAGRAQAPAPGDSVTMPVKAINHSPNSTVAVYLPEKDLLPESIAFDIKDGSFYAGSTRKGKIVRVGRNGNASDFITARQDGLWQVIGIKIHPLRRVLWACSYDGENLEGFQAGNGRAAGVFCFNLDTGKLIRKWVLETPGEVHAFNDLVLTRGNDAYITHMFDEASVYRISDKTRALEVFARPEGMKDPNGITISPDEKTLFVADERGITAIDREKGTARRLAAAPDDPLGGIDGLYWHEGSLIAVHLASVRRHRLDDARTRVIATQVLEADHPLFDVPTTGVLVGDDFFFIANAQFGAVQPDGSLLAEKLTESAILKLTLR